jgi:hypothetical protein
MKRTFIGLFFILLACITIIGESNIFPHGSVFLVVCTLFFGYLAIKGLKDFDSFGTIFPLAILFYFYNRHYHFTNISSWKIFVVAALLSIGISMLIPRKIKYKELKNPSKWDKYKKTTNGVDYANVVFGENVQYIDISKIDAFSSNTTFSTTTIYFDRLDTYPIKDFVLDASIIFGELRLYIPKEWAVENDVQTILGKVSAPMKLQRNNDTRIIITGTAIFGEVEIISI